MQEMWQCVRGQDPHPVLKIFAVGRDDITPVFPRRQLLQGFTDVAHQLRRLGRGLVQHLPAALHSTLQSARLFGGTQRGLGLDVRLRGLTDGRFWRGTDGTLL